MEAAAFNEEVKIIEDIKAAVLPHLDKMKHYAYHGEKDQSITVTVKIGWNKKEEEHRFSVTPKLNLSPTPIVRKASLSQPDASKPVQLSLFGYIEGDVE